MTKITEIMKKTITIITLVALFVSCAKEAEQTPATSGDVITVAPTEFSATLETPEPDTKTTLGGDNGTTVLWEEGDSISVWPGVFAQAKYTLSAGAGTNSATFTSDQTVTGDEIGGNFALYPYDGEAVLTVDDGGNGILKLKYPAVQNYRENSWDKGAMTMVGMGSLSANSLSFGNFAGVLRLTLKGTATIDSIRVSALDANEYIAGVVDCNFSKGMVFTSGKKTVTLKCGESGVALSETEGTVFNIVIPQIAGGFKVAICGSEHGVMILQSDSEIKRNTILNMPAVDYDPNAMDLGLSVYWATCNVGAATPEGYGDYFAWGETTTKETYSLESYSLTEDGGSTFTKYNGTDGKTTLESADDAATKNCGSAWRMPTSAEFEEFHTKCELTWTTQNGVNGYKVTSKVEGYTDAAIFLPAADLRYGAFLPAVGSAGYYWSSSLNSDFPSVARYLSFSGGSTSMTYYDRFLGGSVRPVTE